MPLSKFCAAALLVLSAEAYKFEPLAAQPSPGTLAPDVTITAAAVARPAADRPVYDATQITSQNPLNPGHAGQQGNAATYTTTTATVTPASVGAFGGAGGALAAGQVQVRNGGQIVITFTANTAYTTTAGGNAQSGTETANMYCAPGENTEMIAAAQGVDCAANTALLARDGAAQFGTQRFDQTTPLNFAPRSDLLNSNYNGRWLCWLGQAATTGSVCPTANGEDLWQKVLSVGTPSVTPTPTPVFVSPSASPSASVSPSPSPTNGAVTLSSWLCLITTGAITLLWIQ